MPSATPKVSGSQSNAYNPDGSLPESAASINRCTAMSNFVRRTLLAACLVALGFGGVAPAHAQEAFIGSWAGSLEAGGAELRVVFHIEQADDGSPTATMDSPDQGATGIPVSSVSVAGDSLTLDVARIGGQFAGVRADDGETIDGQWTQGGRSFPLTLSPADESDTAPPPRPQHPEPPYPYATEEVTFQNDAPASRSRVR